MKNIIVFELILILIFAGVPYYMFKTGLLDDFIKAQGRRGVSLFNLTRVIYSIVIFIFIISGILGLFGYGTVFFNSEKLTGPQKTISNISDIALGLVFLYQRLTIFRKKRVYEDETI